MRKQKDMGGYGIPEKLWQSELLPAGEVVVHVRPPFVLTYHYVLTTEGNTYSAALLWPMDQRGAKTDDADQNDIFLFQKIKSLEWTFVESYTDWMVLPTKTVSPLHLYAVRRTDESGADGFVARMTEEGADFESLYDFHDARGYKGLSKAVMGKWIKALNIEISTSNAGAAKDVDDGEGLGEAIALLHHKTPLLSEDETTRRLRMRDEPTAEDVETIEDAIGDDILATSMVHQDVIETKDWVEKMNGRKARSEEGRAAVPRRVKSFYGKTAIKKSRPARKLKAANGGEDHKFPEWKGLWTAKVKARDPEIMKKLQPPTVKITESANRGCWKIAKNGVHLKSVSWGQGQSGARRRGDGEAMKVALELAWYCSKECGDGTMPPEVRKAIDAIPLGKVE
jgi:hypothetical protein